MHMLGKSTDQILHGKRSRAGARIEVMSRRSVSRSTKRRLEY